MALPIMARDFRYEYEGQKLTYTVIDEDAKTCMTKVGYIPSPGNNVSGKLAIPDVAKDGEVEYAVVEIGNNSFFGCFGLTEVTIGNSVQTIGDDAFYRCFGLTEVVISNSVQSIENKTFYHCTSLTEVVVPPSVEIIGASAFEGDTKLSRIIMGHRMSSVGSRAFGNCPASAVFITAQRAPEASFNTFSYYTGSLYLQGKAAVDAY